MMNKLMLGLGAFAACATTAVAGVIASSPEVANSEIGAGSHSEYDFYLELDSGIWGSAEACYKLYLWGGAGSVTVDFGKGSGSDVLKKTVTGTEASLVSGYTHCKIERFSADYKTSWNNWSYFQENAFSPEQYNYFTNKDWGECHSSYVASPSSVMDYVYASFDDESTLKAFTWKEGTAAKYKGEFPGMALSKNESVSINGRKLQRFEISKAAVDDQVIFTNKNGGTWQTGNSDLERGSYYSLEIGNESAVTPNSGIGSAAQFVWDLNEAMNSVEASGKILAKSLCGVDASSWIDRFNNLSLEAQIALSDFTINTYSYPDTTSKEDVDMDTIVEELAMLMISQANNAAGKIETLSETDTLFAVCVVSTLSIVGVSAGFFLVRKTRHN